MIKRRIGNDEAEVFLLESAALGREHIQEVSDWLFIYRNLDLNDVLGEIRVQLDLVSRLLQRIQKNGGR